MQFLPTIMVRIKPHTHGIRPGDPDLKDGVKRINERTVLLAVQADPSQLMVAFNQMAERHPALELTMGAGEWIVNYTPSMYPDEQHLEALAATVGNYMNAARNKS